MLEYALSVIFGFILGVGFSALIVLYSIRNALRKF